MERPLNVRTEYQNLPIHKIKNIQQKLSNDTSVLLFNIRTDGNIGMIIRQACLMGCRQVIICGRKQYDRRFTVGSHHYIDIIYWDTPLKVTKQVISRDAFKETIEYFPDEFIRLAKGFTPIFLEQNGCPIEEVPWKTIENKLLILGNESLGIPQSFINEVKSKINCQTVSLKQCSVIRSMNVAIAGSIALWEMNKV